MKEYRALGAAVGGSRSQVVFSLILLVKGKGFQRTSCIQHINDWLWNGCHIQGFDFLDHGTLRNLVYWGLMGLICQRGEEHLWLQFFQAGEESFKLRLLKEVNLN